jgi:hypothetical protein
MARTGQIIPRFVAPHEEVYINDNTFYEEETSENGGPTFICPFIGGKGRDTMLTFNRWSDFIAEYGYPNFRLWGQPMYMPYVLLYSGNAKCHCIRLTAEDAAYANNIITVGYKAADGKLVLKFKVYSRTQIDKISDIEVYANTLERTNPDEDGFKWVPIMSFWSQGRGIYGTDFRVRISHDKGADKENSYKNYNVDLLSTENGNQLLENFNVTFYLDGIDPLTKVSNYVEELVNHDEKGSTRIGMQFFYDNYQTLFEAYKEAYYNGIPAAATVVQVDRLPAIELPSTTSLYHLTADDGTKPAGGLYVYDAANGVFLLSSFVTETVETLPDIADASSNIIYTITQPTLSPPMEAGSSWILDSGSWVAAPTIVDVAKLPSTTMYTEGTVYELVAEDDGKAVGSKWIFDSVSNSYITYVEPEKTEVEELEMDISTWDMFGYNKFTRTEDEYMEIEGGLASLPLFDIEGVALLAGSDGSMPEDQPASVRAKAIEEAMMEALDGAVDRMILSKRRTPIDIFLDFNASLNLKKKMASFTINRGDHICYLDTGFLQTTSDIRDIGDALKTVNSYMVSKNSGMMYTFDPITGKAIPVTITLWLASAFPNHYRVYGNHTPLAGESYATVSGYVKNSIRPIIDADDHEIKEKLLTEYQLNYIECLDEDTYIRGTQTTSQHESSDLSEENNVRVLMEIKRKIERLTYTRQFHWSEQEDLRLFEESCNEIFSSYRGTKCRELTVRVDSNDWEKTRYIVHVYLEVVFRTFQKRAIIEIDVNPRV